MHLTNAEDLTANALVMGLILGVSERRVQQLEKENAVVQTKRGHYDVAASVRCFIAYAETKRKNGNGGGADYDKERARYTSAKADIEELKRDLMQGKLHDAGAVADFWNQMLGNARAKLLAMPATLAAKLEGEEIAGRQEIIEEAICAALADLAGYSPEALTGAYIAANRAEIENAEDDDEDEDENDKEKD